MTNDEALELFKDCGAFLQGHFLLTSGLHSSGYMQCALICQEPKVCAQFCETLVENFRGEVDVVVGPAMGGIVLAYELARALGVRGIFTERDDDGKMTLRRGFAIGEGERVLVAEDVLTTGGSADEIVNITEKSKAVVAGIVSLVDRGGAKRFVGRRVVSALHVDVPTWKPEECPLCKQGSAPVKPGSRKLPGGK